MTELERGSIVQIDPKSNVSFGGCLMVVTEAKPWGAVGYVLGPSQNGPDIYPFRAATETMILTGGKAEHLANGY